MTSPPPFPVRCIDVPREKRRDEQLGSKAKFWFESAKDHWSLFKEGRENEDWAEKVGAEFARLLGLPCAEVDLAICDGRSGIVSPSFLSREDELIHGNQVLLSLDPGYPSGEGYHVHQHTLDAVFNALEELRVGAWPAAALPLTDEFDGRDVFVGYLLLDALIGNSDRHHENWGVVKRADARLLSPTYDHGSSLGRNEPERKMVERLRGNDRRFTVDVYASRCRSALYETSDARRPMSTRRAFELTLTRRPAAARHWLSNLRAVDDVSVSGILDRIPEERCSPLHRRFARRILELNLHALLALAPEEHV